MYRTKLTSTSGIYLIQSKLFNYKFYIGSTVNFKRRKCEHFTELKSNIHKNILLKRHIKKYGINDLEFGILEFCKEEDLVVREQYYLDTLQPFFNILPKADSSRGLVHRPESIQKMKDWRKSPAGIAWKEKYSGENAPSKRKDVRIKLSANSGAHRPEVRQKIKTTLNAFWNSVEGVALKNSSEFRKSKSEILKKWYKTPEGINRKSKLLLNFKKNEK